jgi:ABC-type uncharacterized transport system substrate-binding protein
MWIARRLFIIAMVFFIFALLSAEVWAKPKIGILLFTQESHYRETLNGIMDQLKKEGFGGSEADFIEENAEGNKAKAVELSKKFAASRTDLVIVLGTTATLIVMNEIKEVPIVFSMIYDPIDSRIVRDWKSSGNNTTGSSNNMPMSHVIHALKGLVRLKKLAVLYQPDERNSVGQLKDHQEEQNKSQHRVVPVPITNKEDVTRILPNVIGSADALYISGGSILGEMVPTIADMTTKAKMITASNLKERVEKGLLLGVCANSYAVGLLAGEKAAKVLRGAKPSSIPIGTLKKFDVMVNMRTVRAGKFQIPTDFMKTVTNTIE